MITFFSKISFVSILLLLVCSLYGQIRTTNDTVIRNGLKLYCYEQWGERSVEKFVHKSADLIPMAEIENYEQMPLSLRYKEYFLYEVFSIFINADSSEMILAAQEPGLFRGQYTAFCIVPINEENKYFLKCSLIVHTRYKHFVSEGGCRIGMTRKELKTIKGSDYVVFEDGHWEYSYISDHNDPTTVEFCNSTGRGDVIWKFFFDGNYVSCIIISCLD